MRVHLAGVAHHDLIFPDGTAPPEPIWRKFLEIADATLPRTPAGAGARSDPSAKEGEPEPEPEPEPGRGAIAVHCKAGLGRTSTVRVILTRVVPVTTLAAVVVSNGVGLINTGGAAADRDVGDEDTWVGRRGVHRVCSAAAADHTAVIDPHNIDYPRKRWP